jgi:pimeloyl-ACP methyl ester carboxylesterase
LAADLRLAYAERGRESDPVVILHPGPTDSWRSYEPVLDRLPPGIRAIALSPRGHGESDKPERGYTVEDFATDVVAVLDALGIRRAVLAGHSASCLVARRVALDHPQRVAGLVLEASPHHLGADAAFREFVHSVALHLADPIDRDFARSFVVDTSSDDIDPALVDALVDDVLSVPARVWREMFADLLAYDDTVRLADITAPTLLVWGDRDGLVPRAIQDTLAEHIPATELTVYAGAGHTPRWDDPQRFADDLAAFVGRVDGR